MELSIFSNSRKQSLRFGELRENRHRRPRTSLRATAPASSINRLLLLAQLVARFNFLFFIGDEIRRS